MTIRLPDDLMLRLAEQARLNRRSKNKQVEYLLDKYLNHVSLADEKKLRQ